MTELPGMWEEADFLNGEGDNIVYDRCTKIQRCSGDPKCPNFMDCGLIQDPAWLTIRFKKLCPEAQMPTYAHISDAGMDLFATKAVTLWAYHKAIVSTGIAMEIPEGYFGMIRPRSGLAVKYGITAISSGVIDSGYRGEIKVLLHNLGTQRYDISVGDRIAQLLILPVLRAILEETDELSTSTRGKAGHGSTGK